MAYTDPAFSTQPTAESSHSGASATFEATDGGALALPHTGWTADAEMLRDGPDLILTAPDGSQAVVHGYFTANPPPILQGPNGESLTPALVDSFVHDASPVRYAATDTATDASPVGQIEEMKGTATIIRTDGTKDAAAPGTPVYQGDVIETGAQGSVNIVFADETSFAVSENARLAIDEYVYDPSSESGQTHFSVLRGVFVFTSGLVGRDDPDDVKIETPMGSIGIRGTIIAGNLNSGEITVVEGAIVLRAPGGAEITLADQFDTARFTSGGNVEHLGVVNAADLAIRFEGLSAVVPDFFGAIGAQPPAPEGDEGAQTPGDTLDGKPAEGTEDRAPAQGDAPQGSIDQPLDAKPAQDGAAQPAPDGAAAADPTLAEEQTGPLLPPPPPPGSFSTMLTGETIQPYFQTAPAPFAPPPGFMPPPPPVYTAPTGTHTATDPNAGTFLPPPPPPGGTTGGNTTPPPPLDLGTAGSPGVVQIAATGGAGLSVAGLGDSDNDGRAEVAFVRTNAAGGQMAVLEWDPANKAFSAMSSLNLGLSASVAELDGLNLVSLGDVNRDGVADFAGGAPQADLTPFTDTGDFRIFNGANPGTYRTLDSASSWLDSAEKYGHGLAGAGDVNNDGIADILIGAPYEDTGAGPRGAAFLLLGGNAFFSGGAVDPSAIGSQGITLTGAAIGALLGDSVASAGDFNDDGIGDFLVGAPGEDAAYVLFGKASGSGWTVNLGALGADGIQISGASGSDLGSGLALAGDMNGDGRSDIVLAAEGENKVHVVYGTAGASSMNVSTLNGTNGFTVDGTNGEGLSIQTGGAVGDFNGDGRDDFALVLGDGSHNGIYVVYGRDNMPATLTLADLRQSNMAFRMVWDGFDGESLSITAAGDVTGDGRDDMLIGSPLANAGSGSVLMVEGRGPQTINPGSVLGTSGVDADIVTGVADARINAGAGNDFIRITGTAGPSVQLIDGGAGFDTLRLENASMSLDFSRSGTAHLAGIEKIVFEGIGQTLKLGLEDVFQLMQQSADHTLRIVEGAGGAGTFQIDNNKTGGEGLLTTTPVYTALGMAYAGPDTITDPGVTYNKYTFGGYTLLVDQNVVPAEVV
jgi:hypothetical protein